MIASQAELPEKFGVLILELLAVFEMNRGHIVDANQIDWLRESRIYVGQGD